MRNHCHVLIVDGDVVVSGLLRLLLMDQGHRVTVTQDGRSAWNVIADDPPDILVADTRLRDMDGIEMVQHARRHLPRLPVILTTFLGESRLPLEERRLAVLLKPYTATAFLQGVAVYASDIQAESRFKSRRAKIRSLIAV